MNTELARERIEGEPRSAQQHIAQRSQEGDANTT